MSDPFTPEKKREIAITLLSGKTTGEPYTQHRMSTTARYQWRETFLDGELETLYVETPAQGAILRNFGRDSGGSSASISSSRTLCPWRNWYRSCGSQPRRRRPPSPAAISASCRSSE